MMNQTEKDHEKTRATVGSLNLADLKSGFHRNFKEVREFYLDEERLKRLENMNQLKRWFFMFIWLIKSLFLKLTLTRRIMVIISLFFLLSDFRFPLGTTGINLIIDLRIIGGLLILWVLALELKDKLIAKDELAAGRTLQLALLPESTPTVPGWDIWLYSKPANDVGGDLVDYLNLEDNRYALFLGDVAGKGLPAALLMAKLQATIRALAHQSPSLPNLGKRINEIFYRDSIAKSFASLIYLKLQANSGHINCLNAGHMPPLHLKSGAIHVLSKGGLALGIKRDTRYTNLELNIQKGEGLILYSDGVTEAQNESEEFFGTERFKTCIAKNYHAASQIMGNHILQTVAEFTQQARAHDDLSLIVLKRN